MPTSDSGKAIACRNATTHGLFARDVVLPSLGEDPEGYRQLEDAWLAQLPPRTLLEAHYVEKIAAASWRLRRLHRWQAQIFEDDTLTEAERLDRLDKALRHETALHRQIDTAVKMLHKDAPQLFAQRARDQVLEESRVAPREYRDDKDEAVTVDLEVQNRLYRIRQATLQAADELSVAPLDTRAVEICENERPIPGAAAPDQAEDQAGNRAGDGEPPKCENELTPFHWDPRRVTEYLDPRHPQEAKCDPARRGPRRRSRFRTMPTVGCGKTVATKAS